MDQYIGKLLDGRYEIQGVIGTGGMAVVYRALCHRLNRPVAVKILKDEYSHDDDFRRRFEMESQAVAMLSHPNIVNVYDVSQTEERDYIVMELIEGITLKEYLEQKGTLNWREALHFATQICKALEHAHEKGIIHRDIKPHNIMLLKDGSVKVADFGIAQVCSSKSTLTREALGSVHYVSPEQAKGGRVDTRTDIYSLGVVMYEMLTGKLPFEGETPVSVAIQHINAKATMPRELNPSIPEGLEHITMRAMEANLDLRYATATEMLEDLETFRLNPSVLFTSSGAETSEKEEKDVPAVPAEPVSHRQKTPAAKEKTEEKKRTNWTVGIIAISAAVIVLACLLVFLLGDFLRPGADVTVPELYMESAATAEEKYGEQFKFKLEREEYNDEVPAGYIISQDPKANRTVKEGATISIVVSKGGLIMTMPNLVNYSLQDAQSTLDDFGVVVSVEYEDSDIYVDGYVIRTEPSYGANLSSGQNVTLVVSRGASDELVPVPELVGLDIDEALKAITDAKLEKGNIKYVASELPQGTVTFQSLEQKAMVKEGTVVNLHVAKGEEVKAQVPYIAMQPSDITVVKGATATVSVSASVSDGGQLTYEWYCSPTGLSTDLKPVGSGVVLTVPTDTEGAKSYCCKITNTVGEDSASIFTNMVKVEVLREEQPVEKLLTVSIPQGEGTASVLVKLDNKEYSPAFEVERSAGTIEVSVEATGTHVVNIYVDGVLTVSKSVTFTA